MVKLNGDVVGKKEALKLLEDKIGFVEEWIDDEPVVYVEKVKGGDLVKVRATVKLPHRIAKVETSEHRLLTKCIDELADKLKVLVSKEKDKTLSKRKKEIRKKQIEELKKLQEEDEYLELD